MGAAGGGCGRVIADTIKGQWWLISYEGVRWDRLCDGRKIDGSHCIPFKEVIDYHPAERFLALSEQLTEFHKVGSTRLSAIEVHLIHGAIEIPSEKLATRLAHAFAQE